jgi:hypothetical protein
MQPNLNSTIETRLSFIHRFSSSTNTSILLENALTIITRLFSPQPIYKERPRNRFYLLLYIDNKQVNSDNVILIE